MIRVVLFLVLIGLAALGAAWIADQQGTLTLVIDRWQIETSLPVFVLAVGLMVAALIAAWSLFRFLWKLPARTALARRRRRDARGRAAIARGLIAIGTGDALDARRQAQAAARLAKGDPLSLMLRAQAAQLSGDRNEARDAFHAMTSRADTRLFGLRGLFIEAQRSDDPLGAVAVAEEALKIAPSSAWASQALLGFRCAQGDWAGAMKILDGNRSSGLITSAEWQRQRAVLLTAQALECEASDRDRSRAAAMEAVRLAPTLIPAAVLAAKFHSESGQIRKAMRIIESAWRTQPHPDLADAYSHVRLSDSARERLGRAEQLAARMPGEIEGALAVARAAIDAAEYSRARSALAPFIAAPTQRVAMLMAEIERTETGDDGRAREWTLRAVRAALDPAWTADGYVSDRWRPVSPVTGRLDAFQWMVPVAALSAPAETQALPPPAPVAPAPAAAQAPIELPPVLQSLPPPPPEQPKAPPRRAEPPPSRAESPPRQPEAPPAVFRPRSDIAKMPPPAPIPPVVPIAHVPDDPGIDDDLDAELSADGSGRAQPAGWRGFLSRMSR